MMHKAWSSMEEVPFCFSRSSVNFQGHTALKIVEFDPNWAFPDCNSKFEITNGYKMMHKAWSSIEEVPYCFSRSFVKLQGHTAKKNCRFWPKLGVSGLLLQLEFTDDYEMMHRAWSSIIEVPYCFSRSYVKFQGHMALKIVEFDPNWAFPDCNSSLNSPMAMKCCTKLETAKERCPIVFQGHPSNFKVTWDKTSPILTQIGRFRTIGRSQLSNPSDLPC